MDEDIESLSPEELEEFIQERVNDHDRDRSKMLYEHTFPLGEAWRIHMVFVKKHKILKQYAGVKNYCRIKFDCSYELMRKAEKALAYRDQAQKAMEWLDDGCETDSHPAWHGWQPKQTETALWIVEVCEGFLNRMSAPPEPQQKKGQKEKENDGDDDGRLESDMPLEEALVLTEKKVLHLEDQLNKTSQTQIDMGHQIRELEERNRTLENLLIENGIDVPPPVSKPSPAITEWLDGLTEQPDIVPVDVPVEVEVEEVAQATDGVRIDPPPTEAAVVADCFPAGALQAIAASRVAAANYVDPPKRRRGRPAGSKNKPKQPDEPVE